MKTKRLPIAIGLLCAILILSGLALWDMNRGVTQLNRALQEARGTPPEQQALLLERCEALPALWEQTEARFVLYISHGTLDHITQMVAELPALAAYQDYSNLYSHLDSTLALLEDLWQSSLPSYRTLL